MPFQGGSSEGEDPVSCQRSGYAFEVLSRTVRARGTLLVEGRSFVSGVVSFIARYPGPEMDDRAFSAEMPRRGDYHRGQYLLSFHF
jgi:hypothetical protein